VTLNEENFTGDTPDLGVANMFHTDNRELNTSEGRWISPDPAGAGWNQYAYATNPNSSIDPSGLVTIPPSWYLAFEEGAGGFESLSYTDQVTGIPPASGTVGADSGSSASSSSSSSSPPPLCFCTNDITSGASAGTAGLPDLFACQTCGTFDFSNAQELSLSYNSLDYLMATDPVLRYGLMIFGMLGGADEEGVDEVSLTGEATGVNDFDLGQDDFEHIIEGHTFGGSDTAYNSIFLGDAQDVANLIQNSQSSWSVVQGNGNFAYINFTNENVGFLANGQGTNVYTVIVNPAGGVVTSYPGFPGQP